jgi:Resolvase, N terminal domain
MATVGKHKTRLTYSDWACAAGSLSRVLSVRRCVPWPLKARGVVLHLLDLGGDISGNGLSKLFLTIAAAFAEAERDRIRERIGQVKADQKARGRNLGGKVPFGYLMPRLPHP